MFNHEPDGYACPFCRLAAGGEDELNSQEDRVAENDKAMALISPRWWPNNHGHVLVVPKTHHENLYDLPGEYGHAVHDLVREVAIGIRETYDCTGVSTRQHNEPDGNQDAWHYHVHVFPRYPNDDLYGSPPMRGFVGGERRWPYAKKLRDYFASR